MTAMEAVARRVQADRSSGSGWLSVSDDSVVGTALELAQVFRTELPHSASLQRVAERLDDLGRAPEELRRLLTGIEVVLAYVTEGAAP